MSPQSARQRIDVEDAAEGRINGNGAVSRDSQDSKRLPCKASRIQVWLASSVTPDTILAWHCRLVAQKWDHSQWRGPAPTDNVIRTILRKTNRRSARTWAVNEQVSSSFRGQFDRRSTESCDQRRPFVLFVNIRQGVSRLRSAAVTMMQTADLRNRGHLAFLFDFSFKRRIPIQRKMRPVLVIILKI